MRLRIGGVELAPDALEHRVRFGQVLVVRAFALAQVRHGVEPQRIDAEVEPELHHVDHRVDDRRVVVVQIGLVREEAVPVRTASATGSKVQFDFSVSVKMMRVSGNFCVGVAPDVEVALGRSWRRVARPLEPRMLVGRVVDDQLDQHLDVPLVRGATNALKSSSVP